MHQQTRFYLREARRALANAQAERFMKHNKEYEGWIVNAIELLMEADTCREAARELVWRE